MLLSVLALALGAAVMRWQAARHFSPEPPYRVLRALGPGMELRRYGPMVLAETRTSGSYETAPYEGFRRLAGYIFGGNGGRESIEMTAPVTQAGERLEMTTPVTHADAEGGHVIAFVMPAGRSLASLPRPDDERVRFRELRARTVAVLTYSGFADEAAFGARAAELRAALSDAGLVVAGEPVSARYDPPSVLPPLRRNEVWIEVEGELATR
jgi:hypothetical protein